MSPSGLPYTVTGYIDNQNRVTKVETRVDNAVVGDLLTEFEYSNYQNRGGVQVPGTIVMKQAGLVSFDAAITAATPNPANLAALLTPPPAPARGGGPGGPPAGGGRAGGPPPAPVAEMLAPGVFKIGGGYNSLAIDMGDHILVAESGQSDLRGQQVMAAAKAAIPGKPILFPSPPHMVTSITPAACRPPSPKAQRSSAHRNTEPALERFLSGPRTLMGDSLSKVTNRRKDVVTPVGDHEIRRGDQRPRRGTDSHPERARRRPAGGLPPGREDHAHRRRHGEQPDAGAARGGQGRGRRVHASQARLRHLDSGARTGARRPDDQGRRHRRSPPSNTLALWAGLWGEL